VVPTLAALLLAAPAPAGGQVRVRLSGQIETNGGLDTQRIGGRTLETTTLGSRYAPALEGFVWDPRFLTFSLSGSYADQETTLPDAEQSVVQQEPYRLRLTFFSQAPHSFEIGAGRSVSDNLFSGRLGDVPTRTTTETQEFAWRYRGGVLPETSLEFRRQATESETPDLRTRETRSTLTLRARKTLGRSQPTLSYTLEQVEHQGPPEAVFVEGDGLSHELRYEDRIRVGERGLLTPLARLEVGEDRRESEVGLTLAGPLSTTLDGSATVRHAWQDLDGAATQVLSANGMLTRRLGPDLTVTGGLNGAAVSGEELTWNAGGFAGVSARPWPHLQTVGDYSLQLVGGDVPLSVGHRGHLGAVSTWVPRHTLTADYFVSVFEPGGDRPLFTSHEVAVGATSLLVPLTTLTLTAAADRQAGDGLQQGYRAALGAVVTPWVGTSVRARVDFDTVSRSGGDRPPARETRYGVEGGVDVSPFEWLTLSASARLGVAEIDGEDRSGRFDADAYRGGGSLSFRSFTMRAEGFVEREPIVQQERRGVRASLSYRFRIWTLTVDLERASVTTAGLDSERDRVFFRVTRPLDFSWP